jgi:hypothetical protein
MTQQEANMAITQVVLVDQTNSIDTALLHSASLALTTQVTQDLPQYWSGITANVSVAPTLSAVPAGGWPVFLVTSLPPGEGGFHMDNNNQPYAKVIASSSDESWTIDASHEIIEMLVDPFGNRMQSSQAVQISNNDVIDGSGTFNYLVEACDPCEANNFAYDISGIAVSDFITPNFYDPSATPGTQYSFKGNLTRPRQILPGGYISYMQPDGSWAQILWVDPNGPPTYNNPNVAQGSRSLREEIHRAMGPELDNAKHFQRRKEGGLPEAVSARVAQHRAHRAAKADHEQKLRHRYSLHG